MPFFACLAQPQPDSVFRRAGLLVCMLLLGTGQRSALAALEPLSDIVAISETCALDAAGDIWCWGYNTGVHDPQHAGYLFHPTRVLGRRRNGYPALCGTAGLCRFPQREPDDSRSRKSSRDCSSWTSTIRRDSTCALNLEASELLNSAAVLFSTKLCDPITHQRWAELAADITSAIDLSTST